MRYLLAALSILVCPLAFAQDAQIMLAPNDIKWTAVDVPRAPKPSGVFMTVLMGDPSKAGPYIIRVKYPANFQITPHTHPNSRQVTIISGTWYTGYGTTFGAGGFKELPAGSFYTEPANAYHYVETRGEVITQVSGIGPLTPNNLPK